MGFKLSVFTDGHFWLYSNRFCLHWNLFFLLKCSALLYMESVVGTAYCLRVKVFFYNFISGRPGITAGGLFLFQCWSLFQLPVIIIWRWKDVFSEGANAIPWSLELSQQFQCRDIDHQQNTIKMIHFGPNTAGVMNFWDNQIGPSRWAVV